MGDISVYNSTEGSVYLRRLDEVVHVLGYLGSIELEQKNAHDFIWSALGRTI